MGAQDQPQFGLDFDNDLSTTPPQPNAWQRRWSVFAEQRIGWQLELAAEKGLHFGDIDTLVDMVQQRLANHQPQPSLLHGGSVVRQLRLRPDGPLIYSIPACYWATARAFQPCCRCIRNSPCKSTDGYQSVSPLPSGFPRSSADLSALHSAEQRAILFGGQHCKRPAGAG
ncbi:fructosamine kinase family protein [Klebsiella pneumoniae subsp. pneumoniae]|nr:fructosamine kinase family protein [Klebsiella pneumoniae subsp. pneumoniae]